MRGRSAGGALAVRRVVGVLFLATAAIGALAPAAPASGGAFLTLSASDPRIAQTGRTEWSLSKTGSVDETSATVRWDVVATKGATGKGMLVLGGRLTLKNTGWSTATLGNVVVNLQRWSGSAWVTRSSVVADATNGDAATSANVVASSTSERRGSFAENAASGELTFVDGLGAPFPLVPQQTIRAGRTKALRFRATFDNAVLGLSTGRSFRAEILVTYGNAKGGWGSASNLDIDGDGAIDPDEATVRTAAARLGYVVPAPTPGDPPTLSDTAQDITTTGTVTFSDPVFDLGPTSGTVSATYEAGVDGGTITNCAHLRGPGLNLEACDTQTIEPPAGCTPGTPGCPWEQGDMLTYVQSQWGDPTSTAASILASGYNTVYSGGGILEVGISGPAGFSIIFNLADAVQAYLPQGGASAPLTADLVNPTSSPSGGFGGEVVALQMNVDFADAGFIPGTVPIGDLRVCALDPLPAVNGLTVRELLVHMNTVLGGGVGPFNANQASALASLINQAFIDGTPSQFAQENLVNGPCGPWEQGDMLTWTQGDWGDDPATNPAATLVDTRFIEAYPGGTLEVGVSGAAGFSMLFDSNGVLAYLPAPGAPGVLTGDLLNPTSSPSGSFGGDVVALELNTDFSRAGLLPGTVPFGDLSVCGVAGITNMSVDAFLATANVVLGGGSGPPVAVLAPVAAELNAAFFEGTPTAWAQQHLVNGPCGPWEQGDILTYTQSDWGDNPATNPAAALVETRFLEVYPFGTLEVGISGTTGFSMTFDSSGVLAYLPAPGAPGVLAADLFNPTSSPSGSFGGHVVALDLNTGFSGAGILPGTVPFGDLNICGVAGITDMSVDAFLATANVVLGGGSGPSVPVLLPIAAELNASFLGGAPTDFAQEHLVGGPCP